jgi:hypothetical protein
MSNTEQEVARTGRRAMLKLAGAATVGAVAATVSSHQPTAALDGDFWRIGNANLGTAITSLVGSPVQLWSAANRPALEVHHTSGKQVGVDVSAGGVGVIARGTENAGVIGISAAHDVECGGSGRLYFTPHVPIGPPVGAEYMPGEIIVDERGVFWACVATNEIGVGAWERLTHRGFFPITPARVYDSRRPMAPMASGVLGLGQSRTISVRNGRDVNSGEVNVEKVVSSQATAVTFNLTVVGTTSDFGYLGVNPGTDSVEHSSHINWSSAGQVLANAGTVGVDSDLQITVMCGGAGGASTHFIVDITGYYI